MSFDTKRKAALFIVTEGPDDRTPRAAKKSPVAQRSREEIEYAAERGRVKSVPRSEIFSELMLLKPPRWMKGLWGDEKGGWHDARTDEFFSFQQMRELLDARIKELGLDRGLIDAYMAAPRGIAEDQRFWRMDFDQQMERFL